MKQIRLRWPTHRGVMVAGFEVRYKGKKGANGLKLFEIIGVRSTKLHDRGSTLGLDPRIQDDLDRYPKDLQEQIAALIRTTIEVPKDHDLAEPLSIDPPR